MRVTCVKEMSVAVRLAAICIIMCPGAASAQSTIAGLVRDASGGVIPGATVEASSPALIEQSRVAVTDGDGRYRIVTLPVGTYVVTATLPGFGTARREGIELTTNFTATVNLEMRVGAIEETVTVTSASPVVDLQSATRQEQMTLKEVDELPTGRSVPAIGKLLPGLIPARLDVGGSEGFQAVGLTVHGSKANQGVTQIDGMVMASSISNGNTVPYFNIGEMQEFTFQTSALPAEVAVGGLRTSLTPKEGSNRFSGFVVGQRASWQSNNYTDDLRAAGLRQPNKILEVWDQNYGLGGPILRDRVWFYSSFRQWGVNYLAANARYHPSSLSLCTDVDWGTTDRERGYDCQGIDDNNAKSAVLRLTWQATQKHKFSVSYAPDRRFRGHEDIAPGISPESTTAQLVNVSYHAQAKWVAPITTRLLLEAGWSKLVNNYDQDAQPPVRSEPNRTRVDLLRGEQWGPWANGFFNRDASKTNYVAAVSYVTGSHAFKTGVQLGFGSEASFRNRYLGHVVQEYRNGVPASVTVDNTPITNQPRHTDVGVYIQDSWALRRTTINIGGRYDYFHAFTPDQSAPASRWVPARQWDAIDLASFHDFAPRLSVVHDLFGNGRTAVKGSVGRYVASLGNGFVDTYNPAFLDTERRNWSDCDYIPGTSQCSGLNLPTNGDDLAQDNEIGPSSRTAFGVRALRRPDDNLRRAGDWEYALSVQQEVLPRVSATLGYFKRVFINLPMTDNLLVGPDDYTPVSIADPRQNGQMITVYNLDPAKLGLTEVVDRHSRENREYWQGIELTMNGRLPGATTFFAGYTLGAASQNRCETSDDPNELRYCKRSEPWRGQIKVGGTVALPYSFNVSGTFVSLAGAAAWINYNVNRSILPELTQSQVIVPLDDPSNPDLWLDRNNQLDMRLSRLFRFRGLELSAQVDVYNALNSSTVQQVLQTFGPNLNRAQSIIQGRLLQVGGQFRF